MSGPKPTRRLTVSFSDLVTTSTANWLAPCFIAPKYIIHNNSNDNSELGLYSGESLDAMPYPSRATNSVVDLATVRAYITETVLRINDTGLDASSPIGTTNSIVFSTPFSELTQLKGYIPAVGDMVSFNNGEEVRAQIINVRAGTEAAKIDVRPLSASVGIETPVVTGDLHSNVSVGYTVVVTAEDASTVTATITSVEGDIGYKAIDKVFTKGASATAIGTGGLEISFTEGTYIADGTDNTPYLVLGTIATDTGLNIIDVNTTVAGGGSAVNVTDLFFQSSKISEGFLPIADSNTTATSDDVSIINNISVTLGSYTYVAVSGSVHVFYRELDTAVSSSLIAGSSSGVQEIVGEAHPDNPIGFFYHCAVLVGATDFYLMPIVSNEYDDYVDAIDYVAKNNNVYSIITYNQSDSVRAALIQTLNYYNDPMVAMFKKTWFADNTEKMEPVYTATSTGTPLVASIDVATGKVTLLDGDLISNGVSEGNYILTTGADGLSKQFKIVSVLDDSVCFIADPESVGVAAVVKFVSMLDNNQYANTVASKATAFNSYFINYVWADTVNIDAYNDVELIYLVAILASMRSAAAPHAPLTDVIVPFTDTIDTLKMSEVSLDVMNNGGVWIVSKNDTESTVTRHQLTTVQDGTYAEEDSAVSNVHNILRSLQGSLTVDGSKNVTNELISPLFTEIMQELKTIRARVYSASLGSQLNDYDITTLSINPDNKAGLLMNVVLDVPLPFLTADYTFRVI